MQNSHENFLNKPKNLTMANLTIGVDVGGTNTDAVILNQSTVICSAKTPTTEDVTSGLETAIRDAIQNLPQEFTISDIKRVNIGTTHFVNAVVQRRDIVPVAVVRLCGPASRCVPPFVDFPEDLRRVIASRHVYFLNGGYEFDGKAVISEVDEEEVKSVVRQIETAGIRNVAVAGIFSSVNEEQEELVKKIIHEMNPDISVTLSHEVGLLGFLERENASILNESLKPLCVRTVSAFEDSLKRIGLSCPFYMTQNDGTIISAEKAIKFPVFTFASGPTNSMRGAAHLCKVQDAIVVDIGGTTTDVGVLCKGFPRQSSIRVKVGGVITNFRMPDVLSIGLGGGSRVVQHAKTGDVTVGPESVGYKLNQEAVVFGGDILTATDMAVASSLCDIGVKQRVDHLQEDLKRNAMNSIKLMLEAAIDQVKISKDDQPVILVGGGSVLIDPNWKLKGASYFIKPEHFQSANAVGAALGKVSGIVDTVFHLEGKTEDQVMKEAVDKAFFDAEKNGACPGTIEIIDKMAVKLAYLPGNVTRIQVKAVGDLASTVVSKGESQKAAANSPSPTPTNTSPDSNQPLLSQNASNLKHQQTSSGKNEPKNDPLADSERNPCIAQVMSKPSIDPVTGEWILSEFDIDCMAIGAGILGCGGGGSPYIGRLRTQALIKSGKKIRVIHPDSLSKGNSIVVVAFMGAPVILIEKLPSGRETSSAGNVLTPFLSKTSKSSDQSFAAVFCAEIGGMNSLEPLSVAAQLGIPVVDADGMGRAFPELQMFLPYIYGTAPYPAGIADEKGNTLSMVKVTSPSQLENFFRIICVNMGCSAGIAFKLSDEDVHQRSVKYSLSRIWQLGNVILQARHDKTSPIDAILRHEGGKLLYTGKIADVERRTEHGFAKGIIKVESTTQEKQRPLLVEFQNENYLAYFVNDGGSKDIKACVPDLISLVDSTTGEPLPTEEVRYGLRVAVLAMPCPPLLATPKALAVVGPGAFGYKDVEYVPIGKYVENSPIPQPKTL